ncbi:uncharacterized protein LOC126822364 isoform X2 [Patella vulgata]|uniref:uncharacterized protein LOC126822364 isoform X2 n=1 Tax=Patella vulgata TaxID=6465 RepID=UPI00217F4008|nr:uncharacterized protein LOC126822364 isoform X2 [Patella vulgata]
MLWRHILAVFSIMESNWIINKKRKESGRVYKKNHYIKDSTQYNNFCRDQSKKGIKDFKLWSRNWAELSSQEKLEYRYSPVPLKDQSPNSKKNTSTALLKQLQGILIKLSDCDVDIAAVGEREGNIIFAGSNSSKFLKYLENREDEFVNSLLLKPGKDAEESCTKQLRKQVQDHMNALYGKATTSYQRFPYERVKRGEIVVDGFPQEVKPIQVPSRYGRKKLNLILSVQEISVKETEPSRTTAPPLTTAPHITTAPNLTTAPYLTTHPLTTAPHITTHPLTTAPHITTHPLTTAPHITTHPLTTAPHITTHPLTTAPHITTHPLTTAPHITTHPLTTAPHITTHPLTTAPHITKHPLTTAPHITTHPLTTAPHITTHPLTIEPHITTHPLTIEPHITTHPLTTAPHITTHPLTTAPHITTHPLTIARPITTHPLTIAPHITTHPLTTAPHITTQMLTADQSNIEYEVECIVKKRKKNRKVQYLLHWKGYPSSADSWEDEEHLNETLKKSLKIKKNKTSK